MTDISPQSLMVFIVWAVFLISLARALMQGKLNDSAGRTIWSLFLLWVIAFSLWGPDAEQSLDHRLGGWPVALGLKSACMLLTFYFYYHVLRPLRADHPAYPLLDWLGPLALIAGGLSTVWYGAMPQMAYAEWRYVVIGARDLVLTVYAVLIFIPYTLILYHAEDKPLLRLKQGAALVCFVSYVGSAIGGVTAGVLTLLDHPGSTAVVSLFTPFIYTGMIAFMIALVPYRWLCVPWHVRQIWTYWRLRRLSLRLTHRAGRAPVMGLSGWDLLQGDRLDLGIYRTVIAILDHYPLVLAQPDSDPLAAQIEGIVTAQPGYTTLVSAIAAVKG